ncbi:MAG: vanadium-dependent haloperoxidase [Rubrivivax sp.]|nr:vanadium-dependent haloperoxidase [Rubrivivax sp.]
MRLARARFKTVGTWLLAHLPAVFALTPAASAALQCALPVVVAGATPEVVEVPGIQCGPSPADAVHGKVGEHFAQAALALNVKYQRNPLRSARNLALAHAAMALAAAQCGAPCRNPSDAEGPKVAGARISALAQGAAAAMMLAYLFPQEPAHRLLGEVAWANRSLPAGGSGSLADWRHAWATARRAADQVIARALGDRANEVPAQAVVPPSREGVWRATPPLNVGNPMEPGAPRWVPWLLDAGEPIAAPPPVAHGSPLFWQEAEEVLAVTRGLTAAQKRSAETWNLDAGSVTPAGVWNQIALAALEPMSKTDPILALHWMTALNVAMSDALVAAWREKYRWWTMRPVTAIRERLDPQFLPHILTPPFPSYVSGHATVSGAAAEVLAAALPERAAAFRGLAEEAAMSRLYGGIHFRSDNEQGLALGRAVGRRVVQVAHGGPAALVAALFSASAGKALAPAPAREESAECQAAVPVLAGHLPQPQGSTMRLRWSAVPGAQRYRLDLVARVPEGERLANLDVQTKETEVHVPLPGGAERIWIQAHLRTECETAGAASSSARTTFVLRAPPCTLEGPLAARATGDLIELRWGSAGSAPEARIDAYVARGDGPPALHSRESHRGSARVPGAGLAFLVIQPRCDRPALAPAR